MTSERLAGPKALGDRITGQMPGVGAVHGTITFRNGRSDRICPGESARRYAQTFPVGAFMAAPLMREGA